MTIAAGILCIEGVVIAADTKESYGDTHTYVDKLATVQKDGRQGAVAGSGEGYLLDYITPRILDLLKEEINTAVEFEARLSDLMVSLYESSQIKSYPVDKASDLYVQLLVGTKRPDDSEVALFIVNSTLVTKATAFGTVIGCGPLRQVGEELGLVSPFGIESAAQAAMCVVYEAKRRYSDVGGRTHVVSIENNGDLRHRDTDVQAKKEALLDHVRQMTSMTTVCVLDPSLSASHFSGILKNVDSKLREFHREAQRIEKESGGVQGRWLRTMYKKGERKHLKRLASQKSKSGQ